MQRATAFRLVGNVMVQVHGKLPPHVDEWTSYVNAVGDALERGVDLRIFVVSKGGGPSAGQRLDLLRLLTGREVAVAVIAESMIVRMIVSAFTLLNSQLHTFNVQSAAFDPSSAHRATAVLGLASHQIPRIEETLAQLWNELGEAPMELNMHRSDVPGRSGRLHQRV